MKIKKHVLRKIIREVIKENVNNPKEAGDKRIKYASIIISSHLQKLGRNPVPGTLMYFKDELVSGNMTDPVLKSVVSKYLQILHEALINEIKNILIKKSEEEIIALLGFYVLPDISMEWTATSSKNIEAHPGVEAIYNQYKSDIDKVFKEVSNKVDKEFQSVRPKYKNTLHSLMMPYAVVTKQYAYNPDFTSEKLSEFYDDLRPVEIINKLTNKKYVWNPQGDSLELPDTSYEIFDIIPAEDFIGKSTQGMSMVGYKGPHPISGKDFIGVLPMAGEENPKLVDLVR